MPDDIRFLVATDLHVGYGERDGGRGEDSYNAFEEVLKTATERDVDFILCGGDLFHDNKPSRECVYRVVQLIRKYCLNDRPVRLQFNSDAAQIFDHSIFPHVNYEDSNLNVGLPFFTIHGNHDDLSGVRALTALDPLHEAGLLNLFGKFTNDKLDVRPLLLSNKSTRVAIYGIGSQRDDRLARAFMKEEVKFNTPTQHAHDWFNILVLHQNRPIRSTTRTTGAHIDERLLPRFMHLVVWGHEHECRIEPEPIAYAQHDEGECSWSTVATSLSKEEAGDKFVALVTITGRTVGEYTLEPIRLETTRPFLWAEVILDNEEIVAPGGQQRGVEEQDEVLCRTLVERMIERAEQERRPRQPKKPLIRLRVVYSGRWNINIIRFGSQFADKVANPRDILLVQRRQPRRLPNDEGVEEELMSEIVRKQRSAAQSTIEDVVKTYFATVDNPNKQLNMYNEEYLCDMLREFVLKDDPGVIVRRIESCAAQLKKDILKIHENDANVSAADIGRTMEALREQRMKVRQREREKRERLEAEMAANEDEEEEEEAMDVHENKTKRISCKSPVPPGKARPTAPSTSSAVDIAALTRPLELHMSDTQHINELLRDDDDDVEVVTMPTTSKEKPILKGRSLKEVQPKKPTAKPPTKTGRKGTLDAFVTTNRSTTRGGGRRSTRSNDVVEDTPPKRQRTEISTGADLFLDDSD